MCAKAHFAVCALPNDLLNFVGPNDELGVRGFVVGFARNNAGHDAAILIKMLLINEVYGLLYKEERKQKMAQGLSKQYGAVVT
jgi:hypothetical protein